MAVSGFELHCLAPESALTPSYTASRWTRRLEGRGSYQCQSVEIVSPNYLSQSQGSVVRSMSDVEETGLRMRWAVDIGPGRLSG